MKPTLSGIKKAFKKASAGTEPMKNPPLGLAGMNESKQQYKTGSFRNDAPGKGAYELISPIAMKRLACVLERGAKKYSHRNWEKGQPLGRLLQGAIRHLNQHLEGYRDEDHMGQALWNVMAFIHIEEMIHRGILPAQLDDLPQYHPAKASREYLAGTGLLEQLDAVDEASKRALAYVMKERAKARRKAKLKVCICPRGRNWGSYKNQPSCNACLKAVDCEDDRPEMARKRKKAKARRKK